ncbi:unnamed protein product [Gadus morhua 'NCC']
MEPDRSTGPLPGKVTPWNRGSSPAKSGVESLVITPSETLRLAARGATILSREPTTVAPRRHAFSGPQGMATMMTLALSAPLKTSGALPRRRTPQAAQSTDELAIGNEC